MQHFYRFKITKSADANCFIDTLFGVMVAWGLPVFLVK